MLIRRQDISVLLFYYLGYSRIRNFFSRLQHKQHTRFVAFHDIKPKSLDTFESKLRFLKNNTNVVSFCDFSSGRLSSRKINVVITFDDGFKSWVKYALPILKRLELPATFFVSSGFVGLSKGNETEFVKSKLMLDKLPNQGLPLGLNSNDIKNIVGNGFTIGGHTLNHCDLSKLPDASQLEYEITEDKIRLERITGEKIEYFAYPLGAFLNPKINLTEILRQSGYKGAVTTAPGFNTANSDPFLLNRELTDSSMSKQIFRARVYGNYDGVMILKKRLQMFLKQL